MRHYPRLRTFGDPYGTSRRVALPLHASGSVLYLKVGNTTVAVPPDF